MCGKLKNHCERGKNGKFGRIEFAIGCDVTDKFKAAALQIDLGKATTLTRNGGWEYNHYRRILNIKRRLLKCQFMSTNARSAAQNLSCCRIWVPLMRVLPVQNVTLLSL
jgi:hypothetical protein